MPQPSQAELFARTFQSQVARNPGAAGLTLPILRELGVVAAVHASCASAHDVAPGVVVNTLVMNRLQAPRPLYKVEAWLKSTALGQALDIQPEQAHDTRLGETLDAIYLHYLTIWHTIVQAAVQRYRLPLDWLHYDITSAYFEGLYTESELVKFGYRRDQHPDSKPINLGLMSLVTVCRRRFAFSWATLPTVRRHGRTAKRCVRCSLKRSAPKRRSCTTERWVRRKRSCGTVSISNGSLRQ